MTNLPPAQLSAKPAPGVVSSAGASQRLESVDLLRGLVMVLMALDHTRDFFHRGAFAGWDPLDLNHTTVPLFFTRWITHFCAPVFVFLAGTGAFLALGRGRNPAQLSWFLFTRGLWLIVLELTWVRWFGWDFAINRPEHWFLVIWAIGWSMIVLAALVHLPRTAILIFGLALILGHNATDGIEPARWGALGWLWQVLHAGGKFQFAALPGVQFGAGYPLIPWVGVMAVGFCFGGMLQWDREKRRRWMFRLGLGLTIGFVLLRVSNLYGDPKRWTVPDNPWLTPLALLDCHKYPPSLCYLLMTLGPALLVLAWLDRPLPAWLRPFLVFGRVPLFYYLIHLPLIHGLSLVAHWLSLGRADWLYGQTPAKAPPEAGFGLLVTYAVWLLVVLLLYPVCARFADLKRRRRDAWLSYF